MPPREIPPLPPPPIDDLQVRDSGVGQWTLDKLEIIWRYLIAFSNACKNKAPSFHFVDGFSGPGVNVIAGQRVTGSPLLGLEVDPPFSSCLLMDSGDVVTDVLRERTQKFGSRAQVKQGDCNQDLIPAMRELLGPWDPALVLLDPEGTELSWSTVRAVAEFKTRKTRLEQLILLATHTGFLRMLARDGKVEDWAAEKMTYLYGNDAWRDIHARRVANDISTDKATTEYVRLYGDGLRGLGYSHVLDREIRDRGFQGRLRYFLIFATEHEAGYSIMNHIFNTVTAAAAPQLSLFPQERRRRIEE